MGLAVCSPCVSNFHVTDCWHSADLRTAYCPTQMQFAGFGSSPLAHGHHLGMVWTKAPHSLATHFIILFSYPFCRNWWCTNMGTSNSANFLSVTLRQTISSVPGSRAALHQIWDSVWMILAKNDPAHLRSQFHNFFSNLIFKDSSDLPPPPPFSILNEKTRSRRKLYRNWYTCFSILNWPEPPPSHP